MKQSYTPGTTKLDPRLVANTPTAGSEGVGQDGGFAVPPDFVAAISQKILADDSLLRMTDIRETTSNTFIFPRDETTPWQISGGVLASWKPEDGQLAQSKVALTNGTIKLNKLTAFVLCTDEVLEDASALQQHIETVTPSKINFAVE